MACAVTRCATNQAPHGRIFTVEQRVFTDWYPFRLARVGAAIFADVGRTWGSGSRRQQRSRAAQRHRLRTALGQYALSGLGNVLHVDFAFPLSGSAGIQSFQFLVQTLQSF